MIIARFVGTVLGVGLCFLPAFAAAKVTLPFSTTYNCAEQAQGAAGWVNCDGLMAYGSWTTINGSPERITSAANYPGGGGGRGQRHAIGMQTQPDLSGSLKVEFAEEQELYIRYYVRWEAGLKIGDGSASPLKEQKLVYLVGNYAGQSNGLHIDIKDSSFRVVVAGNPFDPVNNKGWNYLFGGGSDPASDGRWMRFEFHLKNGSGSTGIFQAWADGELVTNLSNVTYGSTGFSGFVLPENHQFRTPGGPSVDSWQDMDDLAVRTTGPIGPIGSPAAPTKLRVLQ